MTRRSSPMGGAATPRPHLPHAARSPAPAAPRLVSLAELADRWRVSPRTVQRLVGAGRLTAIRIGRQLRFSVSEIERHERSKTG